jgi:molecular chaperone HtpG
VVQNSLDAIRLQRLLSSAEEPYRIAIHWDSQQRTLTVEDNGTGMTQDIIEQNLLTVGASRYQDPNFKKEFPNFHPISRFGIGVLSTFMVADNVEIITCHPSEQEARRISLRSVHGRYLIRLLNKESDPVARRIGPHGTMVKLRVRPSAELGDIVATARRWVVIPGCDVLVTIDDSSPVRIGFASPRDAVVHVLEALNIQVDESPESHRRRRTTVIEREHNGVVLAYAVQWSEYFREWSFLAYPSGRRNRVPGADALLGTCIEGVRVEFPTPGYTDNSIIAIANATGANAPKTNVARSSLEMTSEYEAMLRSIFTIYCNHVGDEVRQLNSERHFSLSWATREAKYLLRPLLPDDEFGRGDPEHRVVQAVLLDQIAQLPIFLLEQNDDRSAISAAELQAMQTFWTTSSALIRFAEHLLAEVPGEASLSSLLQALHTHGYQLPEPILSGSNSDDVVDGLAFAGKEVGLIHVRRDERRIDLAWVQEAQPSRWHKVKLRTDEDGYVVEVLNAGIRGRRSDTYMLGQHGIEVKGLGDEVAVRAGNLLYLLPSWNVTKFISSLLKQFADDPAVRMVSEITLTTVDSLLGSKERRVDRDSIATRVDAVLSTISPATRRHIMTVLDYDNMIDQFAEARWEVFDISAWARTYGL